MSVKLHPGLAKATPTCREETRRQNELDARLRIVRFWKDNNRHTELVASICGCSVDAVEKWISGERRVPGWALVAIERRAA